MDGVIKENIYLSVVIPLFNEEGNIDVLLKDLEDNLQNLGVSYEIILVDDGSRDQTWAKIKEAANVNSSITGIRLARNFGHQHALLAGLNRASGKAIISMDGDLQHPPSLIPQMLASYEKGASVVNTFRNDRNVNSFFKRKTSWIFYKLFSFATGVQVVPGSSDFRLIDRSVLDQLLQLKDVDLFLRGAVEWLGFPSVTLSYAAGARFSGRSKYTVSKMVKFGSGSIISFSTKPLVLGVWIGVLTSVLAFLELVYILFRFSIGQTVPGWASTVGIISFLFGVLFIVLGIIGTYLARIHVALQNRPRFIMSEVHDQKSTGRTG